MVKADKLGQSVPLTASQKLTIKSCVRASVLEPDNWKSGPSSVTFYLDGFGHAIPPISLSCDEMVVLCEDGR
jgi:hypothetical protein